MLLLQFPCLGLVEQFNLGIEDIAEIQQETKRGLGGHLPEVGKPLVVEILLRTPESDNLVLELWTLTIVETSDTSPARINPTIYNRMTVRAGTTLLSRDYDGVGCSIHVRV